ncbi:MAG: hypothetical protein ABSD70_03245 [Terracidiphilus sp.]|jgi:hypothetical protein
MNYFNEALRRIGHARGWVAAQFWATLLIVLAGVGWTRLPDRYAWQVGLSLLIPVFLLALAIVLEAGTMRKLLNQEEGRVSLPMGAVTLAVWAVVVWLAWWFLNWCDDQTGLWAGYLNSRFGASERATVFTYQHLQSWLTLLIWVFRWIAVPAKVIPHAVASAQWGWRPPWRRVFRLLLNWRWWIAAVIAAQAGVALPSHFFSAVPHGAVTHQVWAVIFKLAGAYLLGVVCWVLLLAWAAVLLERRAPTANQPGDDSLVPVPVRSGPLGEDSVRLPSPESGGDAGGNA